MKLKVFISYSRRDSSDFAEELVAGLDLAGFAPFLDRHDIAAGEDWEARLAGLIQQADTVVFVVSPEAVKSERCGWEVDKTVALSKRLLPVIFKPVSNSNIPQALRRLQFIRFDSGPGVIRPLGQLAEALRRDLDWIREHTRLGELAARWQSRGRLESLLVRDDELDAAKAWVSKRKIEAPEITDLQRAFLKASEEAEAARIAESRVAQGRTRRMRALLAALFVSIVVGVVGWINQSYLKEQMNWFTTMRPYILTQVRHYLLTSAAEQALKPKDFFRECAKECPEMIVVPAGDFLMGSPANEKGHREDESPQHRVMLRNPSQYPSSRSRSNNGTSASP